MKLVFIGLMLFCFVGYADEKLDKLNALSEKLSEYHDKLAACSTELYQLKDENDIVHTGKEYIYKKDAYMCPNGGWSKVKTEKCRFRWRD